MEEGVAEECEKSAQEVCSLSDRQQDPKIYLKSHLTLIGETACEKGSVYIGHIP